MNTIPIKLITDIASPQTLASLIMEIDHSGHNGPHTSAVRSVCWDALVCNVGAVEALQMIRWPK
jgi:hypothetical protein